MLPIEKLVQLSKRYVELDELMCRPDVLADRARLTRLNKEKTDLEPLVDAGVRELLSTRPPLEELFLAHYGPREGVAS